MDWAGSFRYVFRRLSATPLFSGITLFTIAIAISANTAIFSVVNGVLLRPLPYPEPERLVGVWQTAPGLNIPDLNASPSTYFTYRADKQAFTDIGIWQGDTLSVVGMGEPEQVPALDVSDGVLPLLGVRPALGRIFTHTDDLPGSPKTALLSYGYWQRRFGGDHTVLGRRLQMDGEPREIIGMLPRDFRFLDRNADILVPLQLNERESFIGDFSYQALARLKPGVSLAQANADVARMLPIMVRKFRPAPGMNLEMLASARLGPNVRPLKQDVVGNVGPVLWILLGTVGVVLLIACANVANLLLVRTEGRQHELTICAALGASRWEMARPILLESVTLGLLGGAGGLALGYGAVHLLVALAPSHLPRLQEISIDSNVLAFTFFLSLLAGLLFGLIPVLKYTTPQLGMSLREGGRALSESRQRHRARNVLVVTQVALALVLLISSGLMIRSLQALKRVQPGFTQPEQIQTLRVYIPEAEAKDPVRVVRLWSEFVQRIAALPGVTAVGLSNSITMDGHTDNDPIFVEGLVNVETKIPPLRRFKFIGPGYFGAMGNPLLAGRDLTWTDSLEKRQVVVVSESFAREYWGRPSAALGKRIHETPKAPWREIVGVVGDERDDGPDQKASSLVYWPLLIDHLWGQENSVRRSLSFAIRSPRTGSSAFLDEIRKAIWSVNRNLPVAEVRTVREIYDRSMARTSFTLLMLALAGGMALLLGMVGIYGVISYAVALRTREIGIRMALGAQHRAVRRLFVQQALVLTSIGLAIGLVMALAETRLMSSLLFEVRPMDPITYGAVVILLAAAAWMASYWPARRATTVDPAEALRTQ
jgi:putative ABC transport system permease protein